MDCLELVTIRKKAVPVLQENSLHEVISEPADLEA